MAARGHVLEAKLASAWEQPRAPPALAVVLL